MSRLLNLEPAFQSLCDSALEIDQRREQGGIHGDGDGALQVRVPVDAWLVGQRRCVEVIADLFGPLALGERGRGKHV